MTRKTFLMIALLTTLSASAWGQMTYKPEGWQGVKPKEPGPEFRTDRGDFEQALAVYQTGDAKRVIALCDNIVDAYKSGPWVERAMLLKARAYYRLNDLKQANQTLTDLKKRFPATTLGTEIGDLQMTITNARNGKKKPSVKALENMVETNPYGPHSDEAQFNIGEYYLSKGKYRDSSDAFALVLIHYPDSRYREDAMFLRAKAAYLDNQGPQRDPLPYEEARQGLLDYLKEYPNGKNVKQVNAFLVKVEDSLAHKVYLIAEYYRKQGHKHAAERYYESLITRYPKTPWAKMARTWVPLDWEPPQPKTQDEETPPSEVKPSMEQKPETTVTPPEETEPETQVTPSEETRPETPSTPPEETKPEETKTTPEIKGEEKQPEEKTPETPAPGSAEEKLENK